MPVRGSLSLSDKQALEVIKILRQSYTDRAKYAGRDLRSMGEEERVKMREEFRKTEEQIESVLDETQKAKYVEIRSSTRQRPAAAPNGGRGKRQSGSGK